MRSSQQIRQFTTRCISGGLAVLIWLLSLASVSPALHQWLHAEEAACEHSCHAHHEADPDPNEAGHVCAVTILDQGATAAVPVALPLPTKVALQSLAIEAERIWCGQAPLRRCARAPPTVSVG